MTADTPITELKGVGNVMQLKLSALGIGCVGDLIHYYPRRYEDYSNVQSVGQLKPGAVTVRAKITQAKGRYASRGLHVTEAIASDSTGSVRLIWFNQPYRSASLKANADYYISGEFALRHQRFSIQNPSVELTEDLPVNTARILPIYRETKGLTSFQIRKLMREVLSFIHDLPETLPIWLTRDHKLISYAEAVKAIHFPDDVDQLTAAKHRLGFEEVFELSLAALLNKLELSREYALNIAFDEQLARRFVKHLPFKLTNAQRKVVWQIYQDMQQIHPMNRLVEGDVGSGKTVIATMAAVMAIKQGYQVALMAPTELLARQHVETIYKLLKPLGLASELILLAAGLTAAQKRAAHSAIRENKVRFMVGTHALIQEKVTMSKLGLVIVDEQHRFGVEQRRALMAKAGHMPHLLSLTATPIPRSLALTLYGELDVSLVDVKPAGRKPVITKLCLSNSRQQIYRTIDKQLAVGRQLFVVCPLISASDVLTAHSVEDMYESLSKGVFKHRKVGLLHGKMKPTQKDATMRDFMNHKIDILVSTTVIEVGVNVPNASVMLLENAERFGLAQIHQLRGRVGRGDHQGYCYLMLGDSAQPSARLRAIESSNDGFALAEMDLALRGPGAIYGTYQHGALDLRVASLTDIKLIAAARTSAQSFIDKGEKLLQYKQLFRRVQALRAVTNLN